RDDWEALLQAPFAVYSTVAGADEPATEAQFRRLGDEILAGQGAFPDATIGRAMAEAVAANVDMLWGAYHASGRKPHDVIKRAVKALGRAPDDEAVAIRDWLLAMAVRIAEASRMAGEAAVSPVETSAIRDLAGWLQRPMPETPQD
ncbi:MAG: hypothetical protein Q8L19_11055, partial [Reyranella sp.]|nr:hypothetical protein [Reyranella sp.]